MWYYLTPLVVCLAGCSSSERPPAGTGYHVDDGVIQDALGQMIYLRGINVHEDAKYHPDHIIPLEEREVSILLQSGFNSVRLLTGWAAIMPEEGVFDEVYLQKYVDEVTKLTAAGLFVVVDMHQDVWGDPFGNGAPDWACPEEIKADYVPSDPWWTNYFATQVEGCFDQFWDSTDLQDQYAAAWQEVARRVCANPAVVGFDLMNEPWPGSAFGQEDWDQTVLVPFYRRVIDAVREVCSDRVFFLEPSRAYEFGLADPIEIPVQDQGRVVLAPHYYPVAVHEEGDGYDGNVALLEQDLLSRYQTFDQQEVPVWFGEFGGLTANPNFDQYLEDIYRIFYSRLWGSALWAFSISDGGFSLLAESNNRKDVFEKVSRAPVPIRLPTKPSQLSVDFDTPGLSVTYDCLSERKLEVLLPTPGKWTVSFEPSGAMTQPEVTDYFLTAACRGGGETTFEVTLNP
jgi:endoglycosylceramidase